MKTRIYYFSGTGNSLFTARTLAEQLTDTELVSITKNGQHRVPEGTDKVGFVFPTYAYGLPRIVEEFIAALEIPSGSYCFAVATCAGIPGGVLYRLDRLLRKSGHRLKSGFAVGAPSSSLAQDPDRDLIQRIMISVNRGCHPCPSAQRLPEIAAAVDAGEELRIEGGNLLTTLLGNTFHRLAMQAFPNSGNDFHSTEACTGCGQCVDLCPRGIISIVDGQPRWGDECEFCHACIQWCPQQAIEYKNLSRGKRRYTHPAVTSADLLSGTFVATGQTTP